MVPRVPRVPKALFGWVPIVLLVANFGTTARTTPLERWERVGTNGAAPERFTVRLDTTKGAIVIECLRAWAPNGADRFYELTTSGYYDDAALFRIRPKTFVQFGDAPGVCQHASAGMSARHAAAALASKVT